MELSELPPEELLEKELCRRSLAYFAQAAWDVIEPGRPYIHGWHIDAICEHLEAVTRFEIRNIVINMPPRHMKSTLIAVLWPAWVWTFKPESRFLFASYSYSLSKRDSVKCRRLIESPWYQELFSDSFSMSPDQNEKMRFDNTKTGVRIATSVAGAGTGEGGDYIVVDDPHNAKDAESVVKREGVLDWWDNVMSTRSNNPKQFARVIVAQRVHDQDLSGHVLSQGEYDHLMLPASFEGERVTTSLGWQDPRENEGDLLWPDRFGPAELADLQRRLDSYAQAAQLQQNPVPRQGGIFKRDWWRDYAELPKDIITITQYWDCAQKPGLSNDYSVCATWAHSPRGHYLLDIWRDKVEQPQLEAAIRSQYFRWKASSVVIEDKSAGSGVIQSLRQETTIPIIAYDPKARDKIVRAIAATPTVESGNCYLPKDAEWREEFILEHERFPKSQHDDQVDTTSMMAEQVHEGFSEPRVRSL